MSRYSRRRFLQAAFVTGACLTSLTTKPTGAVGALPIPYPAAQTVDGETRITILHTNDTHSQIDPLPANAAYAGRGGVARRATLVRRIRRENPHTLLVDAGDACQGTPYFNLYRGEVEFKAMSALGYDAMTLGNHEFDNGVESLARALGFAKFPIVTANYDFRGTALEPLMRPYIVREVADVRVGIFGLTINLEGLVAPAMRRGVSYRDPVAVARETVKNLRERERCSLVICLSHLGYYPQPKPNQIGDTQLAAQVDGIDLIVSGHSHTFMKEPVIVRQPSGKQTVVFQVGRSGIYLGRVDFTVRAGEVTTACGHRLEVDAVRQAIAA